MTINTKHLSIQELGLIPNFIALMSSLQEQSDIVPSEKCASIESRETPTSASLIPLETDSTKLRPQSAEGIDTHITEGIDEDSVSLGSSEIPSELNPELPLENVTHAILDSGSTAVEETREGHINGSSVNETESAKFVEIETAQAKDSVTSQAKESEIAQVNDIETTNVADIPKDNAIDEPIKVSDIEEPIKLNGADLANNVNSANNLNSASLTNASEVETAIDSEKASNWNTFVEACQSGNLPVVKELISSGEVSASSSCDEGITGLHWAAINNRLSVVKYLCENEHSRADANRLGGKLAASPLHWACRGGLVYVVDYFLSNTNADPTLRDSQNYNALHLSILSSNITLIAYILLKCVAGDKSIYIDEPDLISCTPLHWAAYQGDILSVNILLKYGADISKVDKNLMTPLHWAFIRGSKHVLAALEEAGSDIFAKNDTGKDSFTVSKDMNCEDVWLKVLQDSDRNPKRNWEKRTRLLSAKTYKAITFLTPYFILPVVFNICSFAEGNIIPKLFFSAVTVFLSIFLLRKFVFPAYLPADASAFQSPILSGLFSGSAFWCIATFFFAILPKVIFKRFFGSMVFTGNLALLTYCFYKSMTINPGYVPIPTDSSVIFSDIKELISMGKFDTEHFCINTFIRKPLRSKYSRVSKHLIARFDHYCPWVYNDVGVRNHKVFIAFVYSLLVGVFVYVSLARKYFDVYSEVMGYNSDLEDSCLLLSEEMCLGYTNNHFVFNVVIWSCIQFIWIMFLVVTQTFQIFKGLTTAEFSKLNKAISSSPSLTHSTVPRDFQAGNSEVSPPPSGPHGHVHKDGFLVCMKLLGLDQFVMTIKVALLSLFVKTTHNYQYSSIESLDIPTDFGWKQNWLDFWFLGDTEWRNLFYLPIDGENNLNGKIVDYYKLYQYPSKHTGLDAV